MHKKLQHFDFTDYELEHISLAESYFNGNGVKFWQVVKHIVKLKEHGVSFSSLIERIEKIRALGKDSSSKKSFLYRYGWAGFRLHREKTSACTMTRESLVAKFGQEHAGTMLSSRGASIENYIRRHGEILGRQKWADYLKKRELAYKNKRAEGHVFPKYDLSYFIMLHGEMEGARIHKEKIDKQAYKVSRQYYIDQFGEVEGTELCRANKDHTSLHAFVTKYGEQNGTTKYLAYITLQSVPMSDKYKKRYGDGWEEIYNSRFKGTLECYISKYGNEKGQLLFDNKIEKLLSVASTRRSRSKISEELFRYIAVYVPIELYGDNEYTVLLTQAERKMYNRYFIRPDLVYGKKIIEFCGDAVHANPAIYGPDDKPNPFNSDITASDIWDADRVRQGILEDLGYTVLLVWEIDYRRDKLGVVNECVEFLK